MVVKRLTAMDQRFKSVSCDASGNYHQPQHRWQKDERDNSSKLPCCG